MYSHDAARPAHAHHFRHHRLRIGRVKKHEPRMHKVELVTGQPCGVRVCHLDPYPIQAPGGGEPGCGGDHFRVRVDSQHLSLGSDHFREKIEYANWSATDVQSAHAGVQRRPVQQCA
jgi:hypothetical protein